MKLAIRMSQVLCRSIAQTGKYNITGLKKAKTTVGFSYVDMFLWSWTGRRGTQASNTNTRNQ